MPVIKELHFKFFLHGAATKALSLFKNRIVDRYKNIDLFNPLFDLTPNPSPQERGA